MTTANNPLPPERESGILKKWDSAKKFGIIYSPGGRRFFLHSSKITEGTPELFRYVSFEIGTPRHSSELPPALNVIIGDPVDSPERGTEVRS